MDAACSSVSLLVQLYGQTSFRDFNIQGTVEILTEGGRFCIGGLH